MKIKTWLLVIAALFATTLLLQAQDLISRVAVPDAEADYSLRRVIARVLLENPDVRAAERAYAAAKARLLTQLPLLPDPSIVADYEGLSTLTRTSGFQERNLGIVQPIEFPLKWWKRNQVMGNETRVAEMAFEVVKLAKTADTRKTYDEVLARQRGVELADDNLAMTQQFLQKAKVRFEAGDVPNIEVLRAGIEVARAELDTMATAKELLLGKAALNLLMARDAHAPLNLTGKLTFTPVNFDIDSLKALMIERHPRARAWDYSVAGSRSAVSLAALQFVPDFELGVFRQTIPGDGSFWTAQVGLKIPLWFMFRQRGDLREAKANLGQVQAERRSVLNELTLNLEGAFHQLQVTTREVRIYVDYLLGEAEEIYRIASRSYEEGEASYLEVLEAQRTLRTTRTEYTQALFQYDAALADLEQAVGGALLLVGG
ncbi:MAG: TolC family protein [Rhodothermia bacterium]|nr:MAG: TolC family protein [Rhodothermia bacterium]